MTRKTKYFIPLIIALLIPVSYVSATYMGIKKGINLNTASTYGTITFNYDFLATKINYTNNLINFESLKMGADTWDNIGFGCETSYAKMTVGLITQNKIKYDIYAPYGSSTTKIYIGNRNEPIQIKNSYDHDYDSDTKIVTVLASHTSSKTRNIELIFEAQTEQEEDDPIDVLIGAGKYIEALTKIYADVIGPYPLPSVLFLVVFGIYYIRKQSIIPVVIIGILLFAIMLPAIPTPALGLALIIMALGAGALLFRLFVRERY